MSNLLQNPLIIVTYINTFEPVTSIYHTVIKHTLLHIFKPLLNCKPLVNIYELLTTVWYLKFFTRLIKVFFYYYLPKVNLSACKPPLHSSSAVILHDWIDSYATAGLSSCMIILLLWHSCSWQQAFHHQLPRSQLTKIKIKISLKLKLKYFCNISHFHCVTSLKRTLVLPLCCCGYELKHQLIPQILQSFILMLAVFLTSTACGKSTSILNIFFI